MPAFTGDFCVLASRQRIFGAVQLAERAGFEPTVRFFDFARRRQRRTSGEPKFAFTTTKYLSRNGNSHSFILTTIEEEILRAALLAAWSRSWPGRSLAWPPPGLDKKGTPLGRWLLRRCLHAGAGHTFGAYDAPCMHCTLHAFAFAPPAGYIVGHCCPAIN